MRAKALRPIAPAYPPITVHPDHLRRNVWPPYLVGILTDGDWFKAADAWTVGDAAAEAHHRERAGQLVRIILADDADTDTVIYTTPEN